MADQEMGQQMDMTMNPDDMQKTYTIEEFEVRVLEPEKAGGRWETKATIPMQNFEHALTVRTVTLHVSCTKFRNMRKPLNYIFAAKDLLHYLKYLKARTCEEIFKNGPCCYLSCSTELPAHNP